MWSQTFRQRVCCQSFVPFLPITSSVSDLCAPPAFPLCHLFSPNFDFSTPRFRSFFPFTVVIRLFERFERFLSDSAVTYGDTTSNECDRAIKHSDKKGSKARRRAPRARSRPHDRRRRRRCYPLYLSGPEATAIAAIVDLAKREAGCLKADIFLLHIINDRLARNVQ